MQFIQHFRDMSIRTKLVLSYSAVFILIGAFGNMFLYSLTKTTIQENLENELHNSTSMIVNLVNTTTKACIKNFLYGLSQQNLSMIQYFYDLHLKGDLTTEEAQKEAARIMLKKQIGKTGYFFVWDISKAPGSIPLAVHPKIQGSDVASVSFVQQGASLKEGYIEYEWQNPGEAAPRKKSMYLAYFKPWNWVIAASSYRDEFYDLINLEDLQENIFNLKFGVTGYPYILDSKGNLLIHPQLQGKNLLQSPDEKESKVVSDICTMKNGKLTYFWKNPGDSAPREKLVYFHYLPEFDWIVASSGYLEEFYRPLYKINRIFIWLVLFSLGLLLVTSYLLSHYITRPMKNLMMSFETGSKGDFSARAEVVSNDEIGKLASFFNLFMDKFEIYTRKLEESEEKYRGIYENSTEGIFQLDENGLFIDANPSLITILGHTSREDLVGAGPLAGKAVHFLPESWNRFMSRLRHDNGKITGFETELQRKGGDRIRVSINARLFSPRNAQSPVIEGTLVDITEARKTQELIMQTEKMVSVGGLAAGMAHEINNPLAGMLQNAQVAINRVSMDLPANREAAAEVGISVEAIASYFKKRDITGRLEANQEEGKRAAHIVSNMLAFSRRSPGRFVFCNLSELMDKTIELAQSEYDLKKKVDFRKINLVRQYDREMPEVFCEPGMIQQVFLNLLRNGCEAMADPKTAAMKTANGIIAWEPAFQLTLTRDNNVACIIIEDNGPGMEEPTRKRIFEPFFTTKSTGAGTGLGLSVSYFIITENHGGTIEVESILNLGTRFMIRLPISSVHQ